jgi:hypothetical protein
MRSRNLHRIVRALRAGRRDEGSMLLALVSIIMITGVVMALMGVILAGNKSTRHDLRFTDNAQVSDAGVQQAYFAVNSLPKTDQTTMTLTSGGAQTIGDGTYTWTANRSATALLDWTVTSTGTTTSGAGVNSTRTVVAHVTQSPLFSLAAFANSSVNFNGNNAAVSYPQTGLGVVGTNGSLTLKGNSTTVDGITLYDWANNPNSARCTGQGCPAAAATSTVADPLPLQDATSSSGFITTQLNICKSAGPLQPFVGTSIAASDTPYCFSSFWANSQSFQITGDPTKSAIVYVDGGDVTLGNKNHSDVNNDVPGTPTSIRLQIYTTGTTVNMYNQSSLATAVYAPNAACSGVGSNAQTDFYGSLYCDTIDNVGGWTFHYDTRLAQIGDGKWRIQHYSEP